MLLFRAGMNFQIKPNGKKTKMLFWYADIAQDQVIYEALF